MQLSQDEVAWAPANHPEYLCLLSRRQQPPQKEQEFLLRQSDLLRRLGAEASPEEQEQASRRLELNLPAEALVFLPKGLLTNPLTANYLLFNPMVEGSKAHQWKAAFRELKDLPPMAPQEALKLAQNLDLESYLDRLV